MEKKRSAEEGRKMIEEFERSFTARILREHEHPGDDSGLLAMEENGKARLVQVAIEK